MNDKRPKIPDDWWEQLEAVKHDWSEPHEMDYYDGEKKTIRTCQTCGAIDFGWGTQYHSCRVMTDWPGDTAPCRCTNRHYLEAHGIIKS